MKKITRVITGLLFVAILVFAGGCKQKPIPPKPNPNPPIEKKLPTEEAVFLGDETIFGSLDQGGNVIAITASLHQKDAKFAYYKVNGDFEAEGHKAEADVLIENRLAKAPTLDSQDDFYIELVLKKAAYEKKLPYNVKTEYFHELNLVDDASTLKGKSGSFKVKYTISPNPDADPILKANFGAQIMLQIPKSGAQVVAAEGAISRTLIGEVDVLTYMVLPGQKAVFEVDLTSKGFSYPGAQIIYQPTDPKAMMAMVKSLNLVNLDNIPKMLEGLDELQKFKKAVDDAGLAFQIDALKNPISKLGNNVPAANDGLEKVFNALIDADTKDMLTSLPTFIDGRTPENQPYIENLNKAATALYDNCLDKKHQAFASQIASIKKNYSAIQEWVINLNTPYDFKKAYNYYPKIAQELINIRDGISILMLYAAAIEKDFSQLIANKATLITTLEGIKTAVAKIRTYQKEVVTAKNGLDLNGFFFTTAVFSIVQEAGGIQTIVEELTPLVEAHYKAFKEARDAKVFTKPSASTVVAAATMFYEGSSAQPGIIPALKPLSEIDIHPLEPVFEQYNQLCESLGVEVPFEAILGQFDQALLALDTVQPEMEKSFFGYLDAVVGMKKFLEMIPEDLLKAPVSFLDKENQAPSSLQFILTQMGI